VDTTTTDPGELAGPTVGAVVTTELGEGVLMEKGAAVAVIMFDGTGVTGVEVGATVWVKLGEVVGGVLDGVGVLVGSGVLRRRLVGEGVVGLLLGEGVLGSVLGTGLTVGSSSVGMSVGNSDGNSNIHDMTKQSNQKMQFFRSTPLR
jgi:hypothetical protein